MTPDSFVYALADSGLRECRVGAYQPDNMVVHQVRGREDEVWSPEKQAPSMRCGFTQSQGHPGHSSIKTSFVGLYQLYASSETQRGVIHP